MFCIDLFIYIHNEYLHFFFKLSVKILNTKKLNIIILIINYIFFLFCAFELIKNVAGFLKNSLL